MKNIKKYIGRYNKKILVRLKQLKGTPYSVAAGFACGVAISFTPFIGFHLLLAAITAWIIRGNIISSAIGTLIGNPWTFPFIWVAVLSTGNYLLGNGNIDNVNFLMIFTHKHISSPTFPHLSSLYTNILLCSLKKVKRFLCIYLFKRFIYTKKVN